MPLVPHAEIVRTKAYQRVGVLRKGKEPFEIPVVHRRVHLNVYIVVTSLLMHFGFLLTNLGWILLGFQWILDRF